MSEALLSTWKAETKPPPRPTMRSIAERVCEKYQISMAELIGASRARRCSIPRQEAMHEMHALDRWSLAQIGGFFGGRDHTTALHGVRAHARRMADPNAAMRLIQRRPPARYVRITQAVRDAAIADVLAERQNVSASDILSPSREGDIAILRQAVMWRLRMICWEDGSPKHSYPHIADVLGGRKPATVRHGVSAHIRRMAAR